MRAPSVKGGNSSFSTPIIPELSIAADGLWERWAVFIFRLTVLVSFQFADLRPHELLEDILRRARDGLMIRRDAGPDTRNACAPHDDALIAGIGDGSVVAQVATGGRAKGWAAVPRLFAGHPGAARERQTRSAFPVREAPGR